MALLQYKMEKFNPVMSPRSPLQLQFMLRELHRTSSYSTTCSSLDSIEEADDHIEAATTIHLSSSPSIENSDITVKSCTVDASTPITQIHIEELKKRQEQARSAMAAAKSIQKALQRSQSRIDNMDDRLSIVSMAVCPLSTQSSKMKQAQYQLDKATRPLKFAIKIFERLQRLHTILMADSPGDTGQYVEALRQFQQEIQLLQECEPAMMEGLQNGLKFLKLSKMVDRFGMDELEEAAEAVQSLLATNEFLLISYGVTERAIDHIASEFGRIMKQYAQPIIRELSQCTILKVEGQPAKLVTKGGQKPVTLQQALPSPVIQILQGIAERMAWNNKLDTCLRIYERERGNRLKQALTILQADQYLCCQTAEDINRMEWTSLEEHLGLWAQHMDVLVNIFLSYELQFCQQLFGSLDQDEDWKEAFGRLAMDSGRLAEFLDYGEAFTGSQSEPQKLFKLLDVFECLESLNPRFASMFGGERCAEIQHRIWNLNRGVVDGVVRVFWEFKLHVQVQEEASNIAMKSGGAVLKLVSYVVNCFKCLLSDFYKPLISRVLNIEQSLKEGRPVIDSATDLLHAGVLEIMHTLDKQVAANAQLLSTIPTFASFFLMNNHRYIYTRSKSSELGSFLGEDWLQKQRDKVELCAMQYKQEAWGSLLPYLSSRGLVTQTSSSSLTSSVSSSYDSAASSSTSGIVRQEHVRQRAKNFQAALLAVIERQRGWSIPDDELRERITMDVVQSIVPAYSSFLEKYGQYLNYYPNEATQSSSTIMSSNSNGSKHKLEVIITCSPQRVELLLNGLFLYKPIGPSSRRNSSNNLQ